MKTNPGWEKGNTTQSKWGYKHFVQVHYCEYIRYVLEGISHNVFKCTLLQKGSVKGK